MMELINGQKEEVLVLPAQIHSGYNGLSTLMTFFDEHVKSNIAKKYTLEFGREAWFDANLFPVLYAYVQYYQGEFDYSFSYRYNSQRCSTTIHKLIIRNGFAEQCFKIPSEPKAEETVVPFKVFSSKDSYNFGKYIDAEIPRYLPAMAADVQRDISAYIQELFGNAKDHGICDRVFTCGQFYPSKGKMDFTIANLGKTFKENVDEYFRVSETAAPDYSIAWAVEPEHSTKLDVTGGLGLTLMRDFIHYNDGRFQIVSGNEYWELNRKKEVSRRFDVCFPGTIVNIEIDQNDKKYYKYNETEVSGNIF